MSALMMGKSRLEAFSDGVLAIIITIMVLEMKVPHGKELSSLQPLIPVFLSYALSYVYSVLLMAAMAYWILQRRIIAADREESLLQKAVGRDLKGNLSPVIYLVAIVSALFVPWVAGALYVVVALMWLVPDRRIEKTLSS